MNWQHLFWYIYDNFSSHENGVDPDSPLPFPAAAFLTQTVCLDDTTVKFEIWDTAGQERYHSLAPMYYRGAQAAIVVYDITNEACLSTVSFMQLSQHDLIFYWWHLPCMQPNPYPTTSSNTAAVTLSGSMKVLTKGTISCIWQESFARAKNWVKELQRQASPNIVIALSGNKADLASKRAVDFQVRQDKHAVSWHP